jgi:hypothetical protein
MQDAHAERLEAFQTASHVAMNVVKLRIKEHIIPVSRRDGIDSPVYKIEMKAAVAEVTTYLKTEAILKNLQSLGTKIDKSIDVYEQLHTNLVLGAQMKLLSDIAGNLNNGVPMQKSVSQIIKMAHKLEIETSDYSMAAGAVDMMSTAISTGATTSQEAAHQLIAELIRNAQSSPTPPVPELTADQHLSRLMKA